jgi:peptidoglycan lytic transglycosylase A
LVRAALTDVAGLGRFAVACYATVALSLSPLAGHVTHRHISRSPPEWPLQISGSQYAPAAWTDIPGWNADDHLAAFRTFRASCKPIVAQPPNAPSDSRALGSSLRAPCEAARADDIRDNARAAAFFVRHFLPLQISRLGEDEGFVTGYYEPIIDGSRTQTDVYTVPVYRRPSNLFVRGKKQSDTGLPNKGDVFRKIGRRKLVPYYDRAEIEDGAIAGRGLEICWLKSETDLLFTQIQGSARIRLEDGTTIRINYDAHNGYPYTPVGRVLIDRGIIPREQMSMERIREWMDQNPDGAKELRRQNRSYVFFREVQLSDQDEAVGAQGVPLTPGRSIAVDKSLHVYGTPFFIAGDLPIESEQSKTPFDRLMVAQDTGSAIVGPARADIYFGAGADAARVAGRLKNSAQFFMLVPKSLDPAARGRTMPLPDPRPSAKIARLFPQVVSSNGPPKDQTKPAAVAASPMTAVATEVPLPPARPILAPSAEPRHGHHDHSSRRLR